MVMCGGSTGSLLREMYWIKWCPRNGYNGKVNVRFNYLTFGTQTKKY